MVLIVARKVSPTSRSRTAVGGASRCCRGPHRSRCHHRLWLLDLIYSPIDWRLRQLGLLPTGCIAGAESNLYYSGSRASNFVIAVHVWRITPAASSRYWAGRHPRDLEVRPKTVPDTDGCSITIHGPTCGCGRRPVRRAFTSPWRWTRDQWRPNNATQVPQLGLPHRRWRRRSGAAIALFLFPILPPPSHPEAVRRMVCADDRNGHAEMPAAAAALRRRYALRHVSFLGKAYAAILAALICGAVLWSLITAFTELRPVQPEQQPILFNRPPRRITCCTSSTDRIHVAGTPCGGALVVGITLLLGLPAAYALARLDRPWAGWFGVAIFLVYLVPPSLLFLSLSRIVVLLGLQDSSWSLVVIYPTITIPVSIWLLIGFLKAIPRDIEEQAMVDGYSRLGAWRAVVPPAFPGVVADRLRVHADRERVHLTRSFFRPPARSGDLYRRSDRADPRRTPLLAVAAGGDRTRRATHRHGLQPLPAAS
jgi:multiple sugar transport system permease protein